MKFPDEQAGQLEFPTCWFPFPHNGVGRYQSGGQLIHACWLDAASVPHFFFCERRRERCVRSTIKTGRHELNSHDKPVWRQSFTTSCVDGTSPSTPPPCFSSNREAAKARAAAQLKMAPHLILHACSARLLRMGGSELAFSLAKRDKNLRVSSDQRPPICCAWMRGPVAV